MLRFFIDFNHLLLLYTNVAVTAVMLRLRCPLPMTDTHASERKIFSQGDVRGIWAFYGLLKFSFLLVTEVFICLANPPVQLFPVCVLWNSNAARSNRKRMFQAQITEGITPSSNPVLDFHDVIKF